MSSVLVSGASGFVGLPLLTQMARPDREVHALFNHARPPAIAGVRWHRIDLFDHATVQELVDELAPEELVHLAWCTEHGRFWRASENVTWLQCSLDLIRAFTRRGGRRLVVLGTCAEYDWSTAAEPLLESRSRLAPATLYGVSKDALRRVASAYAEQQGIEFAWGRLFFLYGPREDPSRLVPSAIRSLLADERAPAICAEQVRDFMHVEDAARAVAALLDSSVVGAVNIASGVGVPLGAVLDRIVRLIGRPELARRGARPGRHGEPPRLVADISRLRDEVGYRPRWELGDGLLDTIRWWEQRCG